MFRVPLGDCRQSKSYRTDYCNKLHPCSIPSGNPQPCCRFGLDCNLLGMIPRSPHRLHRHPSGHWCSDRYSCPCYRRSAHHQRHRKIRLPSFDSTVQSCSLHRSRLLISCCHRRIPLRFLGSRCHTLVMCRACRLWSFGFRCSNSRLKWRWQRWYIGKPRQPCTIQTTPTSVPNDAYLYLLIHNGLAAIKLLLPLSFCLDGSGSHLISDCFLEGSI